MLHMGRELLLIELYRIETRDKAERDRRALELLIELYRIET